ncbi:MAG: prepilin-type N-terminal cleavage/methylation domain-containing protein [Pseudomonadota bacterium]|jgi:general secretion pathway protein J
MRGRRAAGFTLVEVVVATALLAAILAGLVSALVTFARTGERIERHTLASDDVRLVYAFLEQSLGPASARVRSRPDDSAVVGWLQGTDAGLEWLGLMPARHGVGGLYHLRLAAERSGERARLMLYYLPYAGDDPPPDWSQAGAHVLLDGLTRLAIAYRALDEPEWRAEWLDAEVLPARVRIDLARDGIPWPPLIVPLLAAQPRADLERSEPLGGG